MAHVELKFNLWVEIDADDWDEYERKLEEFCVAVEKIPGTTNMPEIVIDDVLYPDAWIDDE